MDETSPMNSTTSLMKPKNDGLRASITKDAIILKSQLVAGNSHHDDGFNSCDGGLFSICTSSTSFTSDQAGLMIIPFDNVLWLQKYGDEDGEIEIDYVIKPQQHGNLKLQKLKIYVEDTPSDLKNLSLDKYIINHCFSNYKIYDKKLLILINPHGGQGKAVEFFKENCQPILKLAHCQFEFVETKYHRHAIDLARDLDIDKYDCIICASGDGIPHEVINGLYERDDRVRAFAKLSVTQLPCGSGNAMSLSCFGTSKLGELTLLLLKSDIVKTDAMAVTQGCGQAEETKLSFLTQTYGIIADSDIGTEWLRWMGPKRFDLGVTIKVFQKLSYPCDIYVKYIAKEKNSVSQHYDTHNNNNNKKKEENKQQQITDELMILKYPPLDQDVPNDWERIDREITQHLGIFYVGKMPYIAKDTKFFPLALPNDGSLDMVITDARTNLLSIAESLLSLDKGTHILNNDIQHSKIRLYRLIPRMYKTYISVDGESFPLEPMQVEVIPGLLQVMMTNGAYVDTGFNK